MSVPAKATNWPGPTAEATAKADSSALTSVCSTITTASAPRGRMAPVAMGVAVPGATARPGADPGSMVSGLSRSRAGASSSAPAVSAERTAKPSTLARSKPGTSIPAATDSARIRPRARSR